MESDPRTNCKRCGLIVHTALGGFGNPNGEGWVCETCWQTAISRGEVVLEPYTEAERVAGDAAIDEALKKLIG